MCHSKIATRMKFSATTLFFSLIILLSVFVKPSSEFTNLEQEKLIKAVNRFRQHVANGDHPAANMQQVHWDDQLARMAQRDVTKCECDARHLNTKIGVTALQLKKDKHSVQDMIESLLQSSETRPYLMQASFHQMGCAINTKSCGDSDEHEFICYWYPQCGSIFNAYDESKGICWQYNSEKSEEYEGLCRLPDKKLGDTCEHNNKVTIPTSGTVGTSSCSKCDNRKKFQKLTCEQDESQVHKERQTNAADSDLGEVFEKVCRKIEIYDDCNGQCTTCA